MRADHQGALPTRNLQYLPQGLPGEGVHATGPLPEPAVSVSRLPLPSQDCFDDRSEDAIACSAHPLELEIERLLLRSVEERTEAETRFNAALENAREEGRLAAHLAAETRVGRELERINSLLQALEEKTRRYTQQVEREVVMLALDIASRILGHESQMDRLLVAGAVRATLDAMREGGKVMVRVPQADLAAWQAHLEKVCFEGKQVSVEGDSTLKVGECLCELTTGRLDLGIGGQLGEIEQAFENILRRRVMAANTNELVDGRHNQESTDA